MGPDTHSLNQIRVSVRSNRSKNGRKDKMDERKETLMRTQNCLALSLVTLLLTAITGWAAVSTDYDHKANFERYKTYSWAKVQTKNSLWDERVKDRAKKELTAKGWSQVPSAADAVRTARRTTKHQTDPKTSYDG